MYSISYLLPVVCLEYLCPSKSIRIGSESSIILQIYKYQKNLEVSIVDNINIIDYVVKHIFMFNIFTYL